MLFLVNILSGFMAIIEYDEISEFEEYGDCYIL